MRGSELIGEGGGRPWACVPGLALWAVVAGLTATALGAGGCTCAWATVVRSDAAELGADSGVDVDDLGSDSGGGPLPASDAATPATDSGTTVPSMTDAGEPVVVGGCGDPYSVPSGPSAMCGAGLTGALAPPPTTTGTGWSSNCDTGAGYAMSVYESGTVGSPTLRIISWYEATWDRGFQCYPAGEATIDLSRPETTALVLSSYQPTHWTVNVTGAAVLDRIILNGIHPQSVTVSAGVPVENYSGTCGALTACAYEWPTGSGGCDTSELVADVEALTGLTTTSFHGCYAMSEVALF